MEYPRRFAAIRTKATTQYAYLGQAIFAMQFVPVPGAMKKYGFPMAVDKYWRCYVDVEWLDTVTPDEGMAVLIHEVQHLLRGHPERQVAINAMEIGVTQSGQEVSVWNLAGDAEINDDLESEKLQLPGSYVVPDKLGLQRNQIAEIYYRKLLEQMKKNPPAKGRCKACAKGQGQGQGQQGDDGQGDGQGDGDQDQRGQGSGGGCKHTKGNLPDSPNCGSGAHGKEMPWEDPMPGQQKGDGSESAAGIDQTTAEMLRRETARQIKEHSRQAGNVPAGWKRWAEEFMEPKIDWRSELRSTVRASLNLCTMGRNDYTYQRPSRRQSAYGNIIMPSMFKPVPRVAAVIDTSGSMSDDDLGQALAEVGGVLLATQCELTVMSCDAAVHDVQKVFKASDIQLHGGGGTDIGAGIRKAEELKPKIDLLIIITDCYTPWPKNPPPMDVVIVRVEQGEPPPWGKTITIKPGKAAA